MKYIDTLFAHPLLSLLGYLAIGIFWALIYLPTFVKRSRAQYLSTAHQDISKSLDSASAWLNQLQQASDPDDFLPDNESRAPDPDPTVASSLRSMVGSAVNGFAQFVGSSPKLSSYAKKHLHHHIRDVTTTADKARDEYGLASSLAVLSAIGGFWIFTAPYLTVTVYLEPTLRFLAERMQDLLRLIRRIAREIWDFLYERLVGIYRRIIAITNREAIDDLRKIQAGE